MRVIYQNCKWLNNKCIPLYSIKDTTCDCHRETCGCAPYSVFKDNELLFRTRNYQDVKELIDKANNYDAEQS